MLRTHMRAFMVSRFSSYGKKPKPLSSSDLLQTFTELKVSSDYSSRLPKNIQTATPLQAEILRKFQQISSTNPESIHRRSSYYLHAQTGSGKTVGSILGSSLLVNGLIQKIQLLYVVPTLELGGLVKALYESILVGSENTIQGLPKDLRRFKQTKKQQAASEAESLGRISVRFLATSLTLMKSAEFMMKQPHVMITTPKILNELLAIKAIDKSLVKAIIFDEVDFYFESGHMDLHEELLTSISHFKSMRNCMNLLVSATFSNQFRKSMFGRFPNIQPLLQSTAEAIAADQQYTLSPYVQHNLIKLTSLDQQGLRFLRIFLLNSVDDESLPAKHASSGPSSILAPSIDKVGGPARLSMDVYEVGSSDLNDPENFKAIQKSSRYLIFVKNSAVAKRVCRIVQECKFDDSMVVRLDETSYVNTLASFHHLFANIKRKDINESQAEKEFIEPTALENKRVFFVATESVSRGLSFPYLDCIINLQTPPSLVSYVHRSGRVGRLIKSSSTQIYYRPGRIYTLDSEKNIDAFTDQLRQMYEVEIHAMVRFS